jgi:hypothetical protein
VKYENKGADKLSRRRIFFVEKRVKGKAVPLQARSAPEGSRKLRFPDFITTAQDGGKVVSLTTYQLKGKAVPLQAWSGPEDSRKLSSQIS